MVPDLDGYPLGSAVDRVGDEAAAHRGALPRGATVAVDRDRYRGARAAQIGYGAQVAILDDGWEQGGLRWDELWVTLDPDRPQGNGLSLPAGPLRRPASTLREASVIAFVMEEAGVDLPAATRSWAAGLAPGVPLLRFCRQLDGTSMIGERAAKPWEPGAPAALLSGIGSPARLERFARACGIRLVHHSVFPDHAAWSIGAVRSALRSASEAGAGIVLITEKDEPRWPQGLTSELSVRVLRTSLRPIDPVGGALARLRAASSSLRPMEHDSSLKGSVYR